MVCLMGYDMIYAHRGRLASQDSLHHIDVEKCALWAYFLVGRDVYNAPQQIKQNKILIQKSLRKYYYGISLPWAPAFYKQTTSVACFTAKPVGPCQYTFMKPWKLYFGDLDLRGPFAIFFPSVSRSGLGTSSTANQRSYIAMNNFMAHSVNRP